MTNGDDSAFPSIDLSVLTARQREVIEMRYSSCLSWAAMALFLHLTIRSVRGRHDRAILKLRESNAHTSHSFIDA